MKTKWLTSAFLFLATTLWAQTRFVAHNAPAGTRGNQPAVGAILGSDFYVDRPVTVSQLGVFDDGTNGIQGNAVLTAQLFVHNVNFSNLDDSGTLLETLTFDAGSPGALIGSYRFKPLAAPVTLLPGAYTIAAAGFDTNNPAGDGGLAPYKNSAAPWRLDTGNGLIRFEDVRHGQGGAGRFPMEVRARAAGDYAAGAFMFSAATLASPSYAPDYAALTANVPNFRLGSRRRTGSIAVFNYNSFPVLVEPSGNRLVAEAAGVYNDDVNGARAVAFAHWQWGHAHRSPHSVLFNNAIRWASRKSAASDIVIGLGPRLETNYYASLGYQVRTFPAQMSGTTNTLPPCDVLVLDWHAEFDEAVVQQIADRTSRGVGLVVTMSPWEMVHGGIQEWFPQANRILQPFGLSYRPSTTIFQDMNFTNIQAQPYPVYFEAYPAAELLGQDRAGQIRLTSLEKSIALNTIDYALNARPDLLADLTALSSGESDDTGSTNLPNVFVDVAVLNGAQAGTNRLGKWDVDGSDLVAAGTRGAVEYSFNLADADVYRLRIEGTQNAPRSPESDFNLWLSVDGISLGHHPLHAPFGTNGTADCLTPYLPAGPHTVRVLWDNAASFTSLRLKSVHVQSGVDPGRRGHGIKRWVKQLVRGQSGMDLTNTSLVSYVSPVCLEGRDPFPSLVQMHTQGSQNRPPQVMPAAVGRWYADVQLPPDQNTPLMLNVKYQNGALSEWRKIHWEAVDLLTTSNLNWTVRKGDSLLLTARPPQGGNGKVLITVGTNEQPTTVKNPIPHRFNEAGVFTVTGTCLEPTPQSRSITVRVVEHNFGEAPDTWVGVERAWDLPGVPSEAVLDPDPHLIFAQTAALGGDGRRISLISDENEPRYVLSRLGADGPVLDSARVNGFQFWYGASTYTRVVQTYPDQSQLVETLLVFSPVLPDVTVTLSAIVGGVVFEDGTTVKTLKPADFNSRGECAVRFVRPASARTSVCHSIKVWQGGTTIGYVR